jgi:transcriptional regulator with XRE-family HTH domain
MKATSVQLAVGEAIRRIRAAKGYSQDSFADAIKMHRAYYGSIERGERNLTLSTLKRVSEGLGTTLAEIFKRAGI